MNDAICDAVLNDEETLLSVMAASQNVWLSARDLTEINDIRSEYRVNRRANLGDLCERAIDVLRRYLPEFAVFANTALSTGLWVVVRPNVQALHRAEFDDRILERGTSVTPAPSSSKVKYWMSQFDDAKGTQHTLLYRRDGRGSAKGGLRNWSLCWQLQEVS